MSSLSLWMSCPTGLEATMISKPRNSSQVILTFHKYGSSRNKKDPQRHVKYLNREHGTTESQAGKNYGYNLPLVSPESTIKFKYHEAGRLIPVTD